MPDYGSVPIRQSLRHPHVTNGNDCGASLADY
jgi:hypothetical protein